MSSGGTHARPGLANVAAGAFDSATAAIVRVASLHVEASAAARRFAARATQRAGVAVATRAAPAARRRGAIGRALRSAVVRIGIRNAFSAAEVRALVALDAAGRATRARREPRRISRAYVRARAAMLRIRRLVHARAAAQRLATLATRRTRERRARVVRVRAHGRRPAAARGAIPALCLRIDGRAPVIGVRRTDPVARRARCCVEMASAVRAARDVARDVLQVRAVVAATPAIVYVVLDAAVSAAIYGPRGTVWWSRVASSCTSAIDDATVAQRRRRAVRRARREATTRAPGGQPARTAADPGARGAACAPGFCGPRTARSRFSARTVRACVGMRIE